MNEENTEITKRRIEYMRLYFKWGSFIKNLTADADEGIYNFFRDFQEEAKNNNEFKKGTWIKDFSLRKTGINRCGWNLSSFKSYNWKAPRIELACDDYYERTGTSAAWMVTLCFGGRNPELETIFDEMHLARRLEQSLKGCIFKIEPTDSLIRIVLVPGLIERDLKEQRGIILKLWKELKRLYEEAEKQVLK